MKKKLKRKSFDTQVIQLVGNKSLICPNCASMIKKAVPYLPDANSFDEDV